MNLTGETQSKNIYNKITSETTGLPTTNLTCTNTLYGEVQSSEYYNDINFYNMLFGTGTSVWLASRYVGCGSSSASARFGIRFINDGNLYGHYLFSSDGTDNGGGYHIAPVVTFNSGIQVKSGSGTTEDPYIIGK